VRQEAESRCGKEPGRLATLADQRTVHVASEGNVLKGTENRHREAENHRSTSCLSLKSAREWSCIRARLRRNNREECAHTACDGRVVEGAHSDGGAAQRFHEWGRRVKRARGDVILIVKGRTPVTRADVELFVEDPRADWSI
jgi:hypothetical protein